MKRVGLKLNIQKTKFMASNPITSWEIDRETVPDFIFGAFKINIQKTKFMASSPITSWEIDGETVPDFIFGAFKITADGDCSHEIKRRLLLGRNMMTNLDSILI